MNPYLFTHTAVHVSAAFFCVSLSLRLTGAVGDRSWRRAADWLWRLGCLLLWTHVAAVWRVIHESSWNAAWEHTARETAAATGIETGIGVWFNFATLALWTADCAIRTAETRVRLPSTGKPVDPVEPNGGKRRIWRGFVDGYLTFMWFQAAVVFARSPMRYVGAAATIWLLFAAGIAWRRGTR